MGYVRGLGDALPPYAASNVAASRAWLAANPLPANASAETRRARELYEAAVRAAEAKIAGGGTRPASETQRFAAARNDFQRAADRTSDSERPLSTADALAKTAKQFAIVLGIGLAAATLGPPLVGALVRRKNPVRRRRRRGR